MTKALAETAFKRNAPIYTFLFSKLDYRKNTNTVGVNVEKQKIKATEILADSIIAIVREKKLFVLLASFISVTTMLIMWPMLDWYILLLDNFPSGLEGVISELEIRIEEDLPYLYIVILPSLLISLSVVVLWSRTVTGGTSAAFAGGFPALFNRVLWVFWRYIGYLVIMIAGGLIIMAPLSLLVGAGGLANVLFMGLYIAFFFLIFCATFLLAVTVHAEAWDVRLPIHKSFAALKGNILRGTGGMLLAMLGIYVVQSMITILLLDLITSDSSIVVGIAFFILFFIASLMNFLWVGYGAFYARKLVPVLLE